MLLFTGKVLDVSRRTTDSFLRGRMRIEGETAEVQAGDAIAIPPGVRHTILNTGPDELVFLCTCAPGYEHADTFRHTDVHRHTHGDEYAGALALVRATLHPPARICMQIRAGMY